MKELRLTPVLLTILLLTACITINVYFPAAAAENAADILIRDVYGIDKDKEDKSEPAVNEEKTSAIDFNYQHIIGEFLNFVIPSAYAQQPDINISTPGINKLKSQMTQRHQALSAYYTNGAVGMENNGLITIRDAKAIALKERNTVKKLVVDENQDRNSLYVEIANANSHPEWENEIRATFARRWVGNAPSGWWYKGADGAWLQK